MKFFSNKNRYLIEQYKLAINDTNKVSENRLKTNMFFISLNTIGIGLIFGKFEGISSIILFIIPFLGILFSILWFFLLQNYKKLNTAKFKLIHEIENKANLYPFYQKEWKLLSQNKYLKLSNLESLIPLIFILLYIGLVIYKICLFFN